MENRDDEALPCAGMHVYKGNHFISEEISLQNQEKSSDHSVFSFFPRSFNFFNLFGRFSNVIPEETEDAVTKMSTSPEIGNTPSITEEVKKLGLTAETNIGDDHKKFEPYWVQTPPKPKGHSGGIVRGTETDTMKITTRSTVDDNSSIEANLSENYSNFAFNLEDKLVENRLKKSTDALGEDVVDFSGVKCIPQKNATKSALGTTDYRLGKVFRGNQREEITVKPQERSRPRRGELFRVNSGMKRSTSVDCLKKIQDGIHFLDDATSNQIFSTDSEIDTISQNFSGNKTMRRTSSTGCLQRLQNSESPFSNTDVQVQDREDKHEVTKNKDVTYSISDQPLSGFENKETAEEKSATPVGEKINSIGKQTVKWVTTSKVRQTKREHQMFSPTSF